LRRGRASGSAYLTLLLCRDVYHCTPAELDRQNAVTVLDHLACMEAEAQHAEIDTRRQKLRRRR